MNVTATCLTNSIARNTGKMPFFFSRFIFKRMKERGNTHYCFHCGGDWGFIPGKDGMATNCENDVFTLSHQNGSKVLLREALEDNNLEPHIADSPGYPRHHPADRDFAKWAGYAAYFDYGPEFAKWCEQNGYTIHRWNPMKKHDPITHANGVVKRANRFDFAYEWFQRIKLPKGFPYIVCLR